MIQKAIFALFTICILCGCSFLNSDDPTSPTPSNQKADRNLKIVALGTRHDIPISVWSDGSIKEGIKKREVANLEFPISVATVSASGDLIGGLTDKEFFVVSSDGSELKKFLAPKTRMSSVAFDAEQKALLFAGVDSRVYRWKFTEESSIKKPSFERYAGHGSVVSAICTDRASPVFFSSDWAGVLSAWLPYDADRFSGSYDNNIFGSTVFQDDSKVRVNANRSGDASPFDWLATSNGFLFAAAQDGSIEQWQIRGFKKRAKIPAHISSLVSFAADKDGFLVSAGRDGTVKTWNGSISGQITLIQEQQFSGVEKVAIGDKKVFIALKNGTIEDFSKSPA